MRVLWVPLIALLLLSSPHLSLKDSHESLMSSEFDLIQIEGGNVQIFDSSSDLRFDVGYIDSEEVEIRWMIKDEGITRYDGKSEFQSETNEWERIPIHHHVISPCRCVLIIDVIVEELRIHREFGIISAGQTSSHNSSENWVIVPKNPVSSIDQQIVDITYIQDGAITDFDVRWGIQSSQASESDCLDGLHDPPSVEQWIVVENTFNSTEFSIVQDLSSFGDGWWTILVQQGLDGNWSSWIGCTDIRLDITSPSIDLSAPSKVPESSVPVVIDASSSSDSFWGREELRYIWTITEMNSSNVARTSVGESDGLFNLSAEDSGTFVVNLTIVDQVGHTNSTSVTIDIVNQRPNAALRIDGVPTNDGETIRLSNKDGWAIDAYYSTDTSNDVASLDYVWYLDGMPILSGIERTLERPENDAVQHTLMLVVTDDDGEVDSSSLMFGVIDTPSDPEIQGSSMVLLTGALGSIIIILIAAYLLMFMRQDRVPVVRPWDFQSQKELESEATSSRTESESN
ncbi:MAG: hypothetical protein ACJZ59_03750 [Candidatus Thalassarchaeaceae archaeon]